jgi:hypothetical protein
MLKKTMLYVSLLTITGFFQASDNKPQTTHTTVDTDKCFKDLTGHSPATKQPSTSFDAFLAQLGLDRNLSPIDKDSKSAQTEKHDPAQ